MSQIISFSADKEFAAEFDNLIEKSGYKNRSRFIRDAALFFAESQQRGDLYNCLLYTSPSPRDGLLSRMPSSA